MASKSFTFKQSVYYNLLFTLVGKGLSAEDAHKAALTIANQAAKVK